MNLRAAQAVLLAALLAGMAPGTGRAADEIRSGKWQFTTQMQMPAKAQTMPGAQAQSGVSPNMTHTACIDAANPVPAETRQGNVQCKLDKVDRNGGNVTWSMTCNSPQGPIQSAGTARYTGDTMEAALTARVPGPSGQAVDAPGRITGRYLGACDVR